MRKRIIQVTIIFVILFQIFCNYPYVEAISGSNPQPETCNWPSEMMTNYFNFQKEAKNILLWSDINSKRFDASLQWGLFTKKALNLHNTTAIDLLAWNILWGAQSFVSNIVTSVALLLLASASAIQSNIEGFSILFKDRPIVRDYKEMLDIETVLFDIAYFRSKQINLNQEFSWNLTKELDVLIKKYQWIWLLDQWKDVKEKTITMSSILLDLISMNTAMKHFISRWGNYWKLTLQNYNWCLWTLDTKSCNRGNSVIKFSTGAIEQLQEDYKDVRSFWACNDYANLFKSTINKTINNNSKNVKTAINDVKDSIERLKEALVGKWRWNFKNPCDTISDYEMAQLKAYRWSDRKCGWVNVNVSSDLLKTKDYFNEKKSQNKQKEKDETPLKMAEKPESKTVIIWDTAKRLQDLESTEKRWILYQKIFGKEEVYNPDFLFELNSDFLSVYGNTIVEYAQDQEDGIAADISDILPRGKWTLDQIEAAITNTKAENKDWLNSNLQKIADYQAASS